MRIEELENQYLRSRNIVIVMYDNSIFKLDLIRNSFIRVYDYAETLAITSSRRTWSEQTVIIL